MNDYIAFTGIELEYRDGTKSFSDKFELLSSKRDGYTYVRVKSPAERAVRKLIICLKFKEDVTGKSALVHNSLDSGFKKVSEIKEEVVSKYFFSVFDESGTGISFLNVLPSKFNSNIKFKDGTVCLETIIPYSYSGEVISEEFVISGNVSYKEALLFNAEKCSCDKQWEDVIGWGSWDYYFTSIDEEGVKENVDFIYNDDFLSKKVKYIAIDDGWQQREGDWKEGMRFPSGLSKTVDYIKEKGYRAGIWTAPTRLHCLCGTVMRRNSFLIRDKYGDPIMDDVVFYVADPTHPEGEKYLREIYTYLKSCGFEYYKIDFVDNMMSCDRFYDKNAGHFDALRKLFSIIRECVGDDSHIMGCSLPCGYGGAGIDSRRTSLDIHNTWKHIKKCTENYFPQFASHRSIFQNDLDYLLVRGKDTSFEEDTNVFNPYAGKYKNEPTAEFRWRDGEDFLYDEAKFWCATILMSGSSVIIGDRMSVLNEKGLNLIKKTLENVDFISAVPDVYGGTLPSIWRKNGWLYIFNYAEEEVEFCVSATGKYVEIFDNEEYEAKDGCLKVKLQAHTCLVLKEQE